MKVVTFSLGAPARAFSPTLVVHKRYVTRLYTSYYRGNLFPNQIVVPEQRLPQGKTLSAIRGGKTNEAAEGPTPTETATKAVKWEDASSTDMIHLNTATSNSFPPSQKSERPYVPLSEVAKIELQADYFTEGGLHQEALEYYGVVAKAYQYAYPEHHPQQAGILIKLGGAFRRTGRVESSKQCVEKAISILDHCPQPSLELIVEALLELGLTKEALEAPDAGETYEEAVSIMNQFYNHGDSHRMLRLLPRLGRRFNLNHEEKFLYYSPFDYDRTFALADQCLERAEKYYQKKNDTKSVIRVLQTRKELMDKKFFNMRDFAGRIHTMRGHWKRRARTLTNAPTPEEILRYSPTIHQVYRDFKYELNTPIGRESEVQPGANRVVMDMGSPYRRLGPRSRETMRDADHNFARYTRAMEFKE